MGKSFKFSDYPPNWRSEIRPAVLARDGVCTVCGVHDLALRYKTFILPWRFGSYLEAMRFLGRNEAPSFTLGQFKLRFPDDDACLAYIFNKRYADATECPACQGEFKYHQCKGRRYYACQHCGHHIHPTSGTIMQDSKTPLVSWLFVMLLFANSKNGVSAKEIQHGAVFRFVE